MARTRDKEFESRFSNAVKTIWAMRGAGKNIKVREILADFHLSHGYGKFLDKITGEETDISALYDTLIKEVKAYNSDCNARHRAKGKDQIDLFNPETLVTEAQKKLEQSAQSQKEIDIDRLRYEIRTEILKENYDREREQKTRRFYAIASECLYRLVSARPKESSSALAIKAVEIAEKFTQLLDKE